MITTAIKTQKVTANELTIYELLDESLSELPESSVVAISSKVVAMCEGRVVPIDSVNREDLIKQEADYYLPAHISNYGHTFTITDSTLIASAGVDESNADGSYVLWPADSQKSANEIRAYLRKRFKLKKVGVIITDSTCSPLRYGTHGIVIGHSGFRALNDYRGKPDLFGRPLQVSRSNIAGGMAATSCMVMGEGDEQTPIVVIKDLPFVTFQNRNPSSEELESFYIQDKNEDIFAPFLNSVKWQKGGRKKKVK